MPVVGIPVDMLLARLPDPPGRDALVTLLQRLGCDVEGYATVRRFGCGRCGDILEITATEEPPVRCDRCGADFREAPDLLRPMGEREVIRMELLAVRPDIFDPGGLARMLRHHLAEPDEPARYALAPPTWRVTVDPSVAGPDCRRPAIACAVVRGLTLDDDLVKALMKLQENLHWALGRDRKLASIGVYDLDTLAGPEIRYTTVAPDAPPFAPLGMGAEETLTPREILQRHPKGVAYARLLAGFARYPALLDAGGQVMSLIPIINSEATRITTATRHFFIDVTGIEGRIVERALNIIVTSLAELDPGARLEAVTVVAPGGAARVTPDLTPQPMTLDVAAAARLIGVPLDEPAAASLLRRMGHGVGAATAGVLPVAVPAYRNDILHEVDLAEDLAIAYGYDEIAPRVDPSFTVGAERPREARANLLRAALTGLGHLEVLTLILSSEAAQYGALGLAPDDGAVLIENPISEEQTQIRTSLLPGLLDTLSANTDHPLPQRIFEVGLISRLAAGGETGAAEHQRVAAAAVGPRVDYAEVRSTCEALLRELGWALEAAPLDDPRFIPGRGARVLGRRSGGAPRPLGVMGEVHPEILERFKLTHPAALLELDADALGG